MVYSSHPSLIATLRRTKRRIHSCPLYLSIDGRVRIVVSEGEGPIDSLSAVRVKRLDEHAARHPCW